MNKLLTALILCSIPFCASAQYIFKFPMLESQGGSLPNDSIRFVKPGDGSGLPPTVEPVPPVVIPQTEAELEYSEQQSCLTSSNAREAKAYVEQFPGVIYTGLYYNFTEKCMVHFTATKKRYSNECKATGDNALNRVLEGVHTTRFVPKYELVGGC